MGKMKILLITTGGTIASREDQGGLIPSDNANILFSHIFKLINFTEIKICNFFLKDSSNINPDDWILMIKKIYENKNLFDGFVITHGTDTMAYTASILSFVLGNFEKPVILTGSMVPAVYPKSDAADNIINSFKFIKVLIDKHQAGVSVCFCGKLMHGPRVKKVDSQSIDAFKSLSYQHIGEIKNGKAEIYITPFTDKSSFNKLQVNIDKDIKLEKSIFSLKLFPGFKADYFSKIIDIKPSAIVIESFGSGGLPYLGENLLQLVEKAVSIDIITVISTQCLEGGVDLSIYEVGQKAIKAGAISAYDMTYEAVITKLMWLIPLLPKKEIKYFFTHNFCDEIKNIF